MNRMSVAIPRTPYKLLAIAVAVAFSYFSVLLKLGRDWWTDENYSHGLLIPFVIGFILWQERKRFNEQKVTPRLGWEQLVLVCRCLRFGPERRALNCLSSVYRWCCWSRALQ